MQSMQYPGGPKCISSEAKFETPIEALRLLQKPARVLGKGSRALTATPENELPVD